MPHQPEAEFRKINDLTCKHMHIIYQELLKNKKIISPEWKTKIGESTFIKRKKILLKYKICKEEYENIEFTTRSTLILTPQGEEKISELYKI